MSLRLNIHSCFHQERFQIHKLYAVLDQRQSCQNKGLSNMDTILLVLETYLGVTPPNNLTALGEIGTVTINISDTGNDDITPSGVSANALIGTVVINTTGDADVTVNPTGSAGTSAVGSPTVTGDTVYTVTVANPGSGNKYYIDGALQPTLSLSEGSTYTFNWSAATGHPLRFSTTSDGTHGGGSEYTTGVTINTGAYTSTITVAVGAPTLFYYCQYHSGMGGQINTT